MNESKKDFGKKDEKEEEREEEETSAVGKYNFRLHLVTTQTDKQTAKGKKLIDSLLQIRRRHSSADNQIKCACDFTSCPY